MSDTCRDVDMDALARVVSVLKDETFVRCVLVELHSAKARPFCLFALPSICALSKCDVCRKREGRGKAAAAAAAAHDAFVCAAIASLTLTC